METILRINCTDEKGLVYKISKLLFKNDFNITKNDEFVDVANGRFFMRTTFEGDCDRRQIASEVLTLLPPNSKVDCADGRKKNIVVFVTKEHHCLSDLLIRNQFKDLNFNILAVIGNYENLRELAEKFDISFHYISAENTTRDEHENLIKETLKHYEFDYLVLAKFMRILSSDFVADFKGKIINIHHSFLPAFIGANPYKQAFERGVKIIGATAHFVTNDLDEGPIIYQDIIKVTHSKTAKDLAKLGRDVEKNVLANALKLVFEDKVFIDGNKTIIFE